MSKINTVGIVGAGQMGCGIAHVFALAGTRVLLNDISPDRIEAGLATITGNLARQVASDKISSEDSDAALALIHAAANLSTMADADLVIEAASENEEIKLSILREVCAVLAPHALIASNTSSISITRLAAATDRPEKFIGMHFMNPVPVMQLVEVIRGIATDDATFNAVMATVEKIGKTATVSEDFPAFIVNRILLPMINEAVRILEDNKAQRPGDIDVIWCYGYGWPGDTGGPMAYGDAVGADKVLATMQALKADNPDIDIAPALEKLAAEGGRFVDLDLGGLKTD